MRGELIDLKKKKKLFYSFLLVKSSHETCVYYVIVHQFYLLIYLDFISCVFFIL
jgi:hypothetical protein